MNKPFCPWWLFVLFLHINVSGSRNVFRVPADYATIQAAVDAAADGDVVVIADGTCTGAGNRDITWDGSVRHLTIRSESGPENCIIDCEYSGRGFVLDSNQSREDTIRGITVTRGRVFNTSPTLTGGGAVLCDGTAPVITECVFTGNIAGDSLPTTVNSYWTDGGSIDCINGSTPEITWCNISGNYASHTGGGVHYGDASGGDIAWCSITDNINRGCYGGGGIALVGGSHPRIVNNVIAGNTAEYYNSGGFGGGIICMNSDPLIQNNTIVTNTTVTPESDGEGGGIRVRGKPYPTIVNTILWGNISSAGLENLDFQYPEEVLPITFSLIEEGLGSVSSPDPQSIVSGDPHFYDPAGHDYQLGESSPCIDNGSNASPVFPLSPAIDIAANTRISNDTIDIGACEYQHPVCTVQLNGKCVETAEHDVTGHGIRYTLFRKGDVSIGWYTLGGRKIKTVFRKKQSAGEYTVEIDVRYFGCSIVTVKTDSDVKVYRVVSVNR
jgi:hypothetical protein